MIDTRFRELDERTAWNDHSKVVLLAQFIERKGLGAECVDYLSQQADEEEEE